MKKKKGKYKKVKDVRKIKWHKAEKEKGGRREGDQGKKRKRVKSPMLETA